MSGEEVTKADQFFRDLEERIENRPWYKDWYLHVMWFLRDVKLWFKYRLIPKHRYHTLRLHEPGYRDPRSQLIHAMMGIVERYVNELRVNWYSEDLSGYPDAEVVDKYIEWQYEMKDDPDRYFIPGWLEHYTELRDIVTWWAIVQDSWDLDTWSEEELEFFEQDDRTNLDDLLNDPDIRHYITREKVNQMLHRVVELRFGMWT